MIPRTKTYLPGLSAQPTFLAQSPQIWLYDTLECNIQASLDAGNVCDNDMWLDVP